MRVRMRMRVSVRVRMRELHLHAKDHAVWLAAIREPMEEARFYELVVPTGEVGGVWDLYQRDAPRLRR